MRIHHKIIGLSVRRAALLLGALLLILPASSPQAATVTVGDGEDIEKPTIFGDGADFFMMDGGNVQRSVRMGIGDDFFDMQGGTIGGNVRLGRGADMFEMIGSSEISGSVFLGRGGDEFLMEGGTIDGTVWFSLGDDDAEIRAGTIGGSIRLGWGADEIDLRGADSEITIGGHIGMGFGRDTVTVRDGCYAGYDGGSRAKTDPKRGIVACGAGSMRALIYGGRGTDTFILQGGTVGFITGATGDDDDGQNKDIIDIRRGTVEGNIALGDGDDELLIRVALASTQVDAGAGNDDIEIGGGAWRSYGGGVDAFSISLATAIYGGEGVDNFTLSGGTITGDVVGEDDANDVIIISSDDDATSGDDRPVDGHISSGTGAHDRIELWDGTWVGYNGGDGREASNCKLIGSGTGPTDGCIYGRDRADFTEEIDTFVLAGTATITNNIESEDTDSDIIIIRSTGDARTQTEIDDITNPSPGIRPVRGYISGGGSDDGFALETGAWFAYDGATGSSSRDCKSISSDPTNACIYGGSGRDSLTLAGNATIDRNIYTSSDDFITITISSSETVGGTGRAVGGYIEGGTGNNRFVVSTGSWVGYYGGETGEVPSGTVCEEVSGEPVAGCIYGRQWQFSAQRTDIFHLNGVDADGEPDASAVTIGPVIGDNGDDNSGGGTPDIDIIILSGGTLAYVDVGDGPDVVRVLGSVGASGSGADIQFTGTCSGTAWICGGTTGTDTLEYHPDFSQSDRIPEANRDGFDQFCFLPSTVTDPTDPTATCLGWTNLSLSLESESEPRGSSSLPAIGFEQIIIPDALGLWGGLSSALQSFGRAMMEDFTKKDVILSEGEESFATGTDSTSHLFTGAVHSNGPFHARQTHLRGESTTRLSLQGVEGAVGTSNTTHDVNLIQHGFGQPAGEGLVAQGGFHLMQGTLTSNDGADQFVLEGYGAGLKLIYGTADVAMLAAWFDIESDDWSRPMDFSGTQWIVSAGVEQEMTLGATKLIPQARGFWQKTNIEEQGAIRFSDDLIFTGKVGLVVQAGGHNFDVFFTRDDDVSSLGTGLVQNHRMEEAIEAGWRSYSVADDFSLTGELRYRHGLETGVDSYSAGVAALLSF